MLPEGVLSIAIGADFWHPVMCLHLRFSLLILSTVHTVICNTYMPMYDSLAKMDRYLTPVIVDIDGTVPIVEV